jgi:putative hydrolase of the HAD superfamily
MGREVDLQDFPVHYWEMLHPNEPMIARLGQLRDAGYRMALLTNNVREWEPRWRAMLPVDELFEVVVDSAFVGCRKPEPEIYALTSSRMGVAPGACVLVDDFEVNCDGARAAGMAAVRFEDTEQAIAELDALLRTQGAHGAP